MQPHRAIRAIVGIALLAGFAGLMRAAPVAAHAALVRSDPPDLCAGFSPRDLRCIAGKVLDAPPAIVRLTFTESVGVAADGITVTAPSGARVERGPARAEGKALSVAVAADEPGTYIVRWRVTSDDTHPEGGQFAFSVGRASETATVAPVDDTGQRLGLGLQAGARWLHFLGYALGFGVLLFRLRILAPLGLPLAARGGRRLRLLVQGGIVALLIAEPLALLAQTVSLGAGIAVSATVAEGALASSFGRVLAQRVGAAVLLWVLVGAMDQGIAGAGWVALALGIALALADGEASHAVGAHPPWLGLGANAIHIAAMGAWIGGLIALLAIWTQLEIAGHRAALLARFGRLAGGSLALLAATGAVMAAQHLGSPAALLTTAYGRALGAKLVAVLDLILLAFVATRIVPMGKGERTRLDRARCWWAVEIGALASVLALAAVLVSLAPPT